MSDAIARRDWHVAAAARRFLAVGAPVPTEALQRQAADDLRLLDAARAAGALRVRKEQKAAKRAPTASSAAQTMAAQAGGRAEVRAIQPARRVEEVLTGVEAEKVRAAQKRVALICERSHRIRNGQDMEAGDLYKSLTVDLREECFNHGARLGKYAGKSDIDADRIYRAAIYAICDRSNAVIRPGWWVK